MSRTAIALLVCLLVAGCTAPTAPGAQMNASTPGADVPATSPNSETTGRNSASTTASASENRQAIEDRDIAVSGGSIPVEHERVFARTVDLLDVNVSPPSVIVVKTPAEIRGDTGGVGPSDDSPTRSFISVMGIGQDRTDGADIGDSDGESEGSEDGSKDGDGEGNGSEDGDGTDGDETDEQDDEGVSVAAYAPSAYTVVVNERMTDPGRERALERTLAHEFVHNVQFHQQAFERIQRALDLDRRYSRDRYLTYVSVVEGTAVFVADAYDRQYLEGHWASITSTKRYRSSPSGVKYSIARYYYGNRYLQHRFDSPKNVSAVYDDPPRTTEQLLHNVTDTAEKPPALVVSTDLGDDWRVGRTNTNGELFTRIALGTELNDSRAADAAAGWGTDRLLPVVREDGNRSFVWATRWDSSAEAAEFEAALGEYLDSRASRSAGNSGVWSDDSLGFRVVRTSDETVVLLAGDEAFVSDADVSGTNASVSVWAGGS